MFAHSKARLVVAVSLKNKGIGKNLYRAKAVFSLYLVKIRLPEAQSRAF
jgi:hypothetical protein